MTTVLAAGAVRADVTAQFVSQNIAASVTTLRVPATGTIPVAGSDLFIAVGVAISGLDHHVGEVRWLSGEPPQIVVALDPYTFRDADYGPTCRGEIWGAKLPPNLDFNRPSSAQVVIESNAGIRPAPTAAASVVVFRNVASVSIGGPCCSDSSNKGMDTSVINKTMTGTSRGDALFNTVCTSWTGAMPGMPTPDPAFNPEMVPRTYQFLTAPNLQNFAGISPGADVARPATGARHLRWLQSGSRVWAINGLILYRSDIAPDAGVPDSGVPGTGGMPAGTGGVSATGGAPAGTGGAPPDAAFPDVTPADGPGLDLGLDPGDASDPDGIPPPDGGSGGRDGAGPFDGLGPQRLDWRVGCACDLGGASAPGGGLAIAALWAIALAWRAAGRGRRR